MSSFNDSIKYRRFTDPRDGQEYRTVLMPDGKVWMAQNLNYKITDTDCRSCMSKGCEHNRCGCPYFDDNEANGEKYGRLYTWYAAIIASPPGWHLPSREEWNGLCVAVGGRRMAAHKPNIKYYFARAGMILKAKCGWTDVDGRRCGNGTDDYGFSALPGGERKIKGKFYRVNGAYGSYGNWWTATEEGADDADALNMVAKDDGVGRYNGATYTRKNVGYSVRCVAD